MIKPNDIIMIFNKSWVNDESERDDIIIIVVFLDFLINLIHKILSY